MTGIIILLASFAVAIIGILRNNKTDAAQRGLFNLNWFGVSLVCLSVIGFTAGVGKEVSSVKSSNRTKARDEARDRQLLTMSNELSKLAVGISDLNIKDKITSISGQLSDVASVHRESNFSRSDFSDSNFSECLFRDGYFRAASFEGANFEYCWFKHAHFENATFDGADLRGADLTKAIVDKETLFPR
jgi:hypothetical protein